MITRAELDRTIAVVRRSGIAATIDDLLAPTGTGRRRDLSVEAFFAALILAAKHKKALTLVAVHQVLTQDIEYSAQVAIGATVPPAHGRPGHRVTLRQVRYLLAAIDKRLAHTVGAQPDLPDDVRAARKATLQDILDRLLAATMPTHMTHTGAYAMDQTGLWAWARRPGRPDENGVVTKPSADPDAAWGYKTAKCGEPEKYFGYGVITISRIPDVGADRDSIPILTERIVVNPAATDVIAPSLGILDRLSAEGRPVSEVVADREWSYKLPERWALQLRARGIDQVVDLHKNDYGVTDLDGMRVIAGVPHCAAMPDNLIDITRPATLGDGDTLNEFIERIEARRAYAFRRVAGPNTNGDERYECPACAGTARCRLRERSLHYPDEVPTVAHPPDPATRPACCINRTVTVKGTVQAKVRQRWYWGSHRWVLSWRRRTYVETGYGNMKNRNTEDVTRGWAQVVGIVKTSLLLAAATAAMNLRLLRVWAARTGDHTDPITAPEPVTWFQELPGEPVPDASSPPARETA